MPFYLKHAPYATWYVYSVEVQDEDEASGMLIPTWFWNPWPQSEAACLTSGL